MKPLGCINAAYEAVYKIKRGGVEGRWRQDFDDESKNLRGGESETEGTGRFAFSGGFRIRAVN